MAYIGFSKLSSILSQRKGVTNPNALAAFIGRKKYGKSRFQKAAAEGQKMRGMSA